MRREPDKPVSLHPFTFEEALTRLLKTPPAHPAKRKKRKGKGRASKPKESDPPTGA
jgi:hypothetical protein